MARRLLPPDPWGITPYAQRVDARKKGLAWGFEKLGNLSLCTSKEATVAEASSERAQAIVAGMFRTAPVNQSKAQQIAAVGDKRVEEMRKKAEQVKTLPADAVTTPVAPRRRTTPDPSVPLTNSVRKPSSSEFAIEDLPVLPPSWMRIQERVFTIDDPETEYADLESGLRLEEALTPGNLQTALNDAEDNARRAHKLYIVARSEFEKFELQASPLIEAMRDAANRDLQGEKDRKERSKTITDADIKSRASILFPDEWTIAQERRIKAEGMMDTLKSFAELWRQRCFSLSSMLNSGKRS